MERQLNESSSDYITRRLIAEGYNPEELQAAQERAAVRRVREAYRVVNRKKGMGP